MELDRTLGHQEPHWKEFRFDLTQIPAGEAITAAEFRIYKLPSTHPLNRTLHVSMFEVVRERANRCQPRALPPGQASVRVSAQPWGDISQSTEGELPGEHTLRDGKMLGPRPPAPWRGAQHQSWLQISALPVGPWTGH